MQLKAPSGGLVSFSDDLYLVVKGRKMTNSLWPNVEGHPVLRDGDPEPTHLRTALQYGIAAVQTPGTPPKELARIKATIERLSVSEPPSEYRTSVLKALEGKLPSPVKRAEPRGWDNPALTD
jgi:hypothetical protein